MKKSLPEGRLLYQLAITEHVMHNRLDADLEKWQLTVTAYSVLLLLKFLPDLSASEIARRILLKQQSTARLMNRLVTLGYLEQSPAPHHGRILQHRLTKSGLQALQKADEVVEKWEQEALAILGEHAAFRKSLRSLQDLFT